MADMRGQFEMFYPQGTKCPYDVGDKVPSGVVDGAGTRHRFLGFGWVYRKVANWPEGGDGWHIRLDCEHFYDHFGPADSGWVPVSQNPSD